jgi:hypothetical protein
MNVLALLLLALEGGLVAKPPPGAGPAAHLLRLPTTGGAKCLDGSPGALYFRPGSGSGAKSWLIHHEGGGWCESYSDCAARAKTPLGSSKSYAAGMYLPDPRHSVTAGGYFSTNETENPLMFNWNVAYCACPALRRCNKSLCQQCCLRQ